MNKCINIYEKIFNSVINQKHNFAVLENYDIYFE